MTLPGLPPAAQEAASSAMAAPSRSLVQWGLEISAWCFVYLALAALAHGVSVARDAAAPAWPAAGVALALLTVRGRDFWWAVFVSSFLADFFIASHPAAVACAIALGNTLEALMGAAILRRLGAVGEIARLRDAISQIAVALVCPLPAVLLGGTAVWVAGFSSWPSLGQTLFSWWLGDLMGVLTLGPPLLAWFGGRAVTSSSYRRGEFGLILITTIILVSVCYVFSNILEGMGVDHLPPSTFLLPSIIWAVLRLPPRKSTSVLTFAAMLAAAYTVAFATEGFTAELMRLQILLFGVVAGTLLLIGATTERQQVQAEMLRKEARFRNVFDQAATGMAMLDAKGHLIAANRRLCKIVGYSREELLGKAFFDISDPSAVDTEPRLFSDLLSERKDDYVVEKRCRRKDGVVVWVRITSSRLKDAGRVHAISIVEDISSRQHAEAALRQSEERLRYVTDAAEVGYWDWDLSSDRLEWSDRCKAIFGINPDEEVSYGRFLSAVNPEHQSRVKDAVKNAVEGGRDYELEFPVVWPCGTPHWVHTKGRVAFSPDGKPLRMAGVAIDVTARKSMEDAVRRLSQHDALTGLPNRALIHEYADHLLSQARRGGGRVAVVFVDLDHFKPINDTHGHDAGDAVLKEVARRLADCVRGEDFVGRLGGDEFLAVLSHIHHADNAARVASHALRQLDQPIRFGDLSLQVSPSIGLAVSPEDGDTVEELIKNADTAMYHAKQMGRNNYQFFRPEMNERAEQARAMENKLKQALERGEFQLHFQPVVQLVDGRPRLAEALLRWPSAEVGPERFIPAAESAGLMPALGAWVLQEVCRQQRRWLDRGLPFLPVSVNLSPNQLSDEHLPEHIRSATEALGLQAAGLRVELPERAVTGHGAATDRMLSSLHRMGVKVAVDDFGAGTSNINELGHLPLDSLKLDRSFVRAIGRDPAAVPVIDAILALGRSLHLDVVAEGIESAEVLDFLKERNCPLGQGFLFSRPLPPGEFENWYRDTLAA